MQCSSRGMTPTAVVGLPAPVWSGVSDSSKIKVRSKSTFLQEDRPQSDKSKRSECQLN